MVHGFFSTFVYMYIAYHISIDIPTIVFALSRSLMFKVIAKSNEKLSLWPLRSKNSKHYWITIVGRAITIEKVLHKIGKED